MQQFEDRLNTDERETLVKLVIAGCLIVVAIGLLFTTGLLIVAFHFLSKVW